MCKFKKPVSTDIAGIAGVGRSAYVVPVCEVEKIEVDGCYLMAGSIGSFKVEEVDYEPGASKQSVIHITDDKNPDKSAWE